MSSCRVPVSYFKSSCKGFGKEGKGEEEEEKEEEQEGELQY